MEREPVRMIAQEVFYDCYGKVIYSVGCRKDWQGGKWFTMAGVEAIVDTIEKLRDDMDVTK